MRPHHGDDPPATGAISIDQTVAPPNLVERRAVRAVLGGDRDAFRVLVDANAPAVVRACDRILGDRHEAEDVAQEAFVIAYRSLASWRGEGTVGAWVTRIAVRLAIRRRRQAADGDVARPFDAMPAGRAGSRRSGRRSRSMTSGRSASGGRGRARRALPRGRRAALLRRAVAGRDRATRSIGRSAPSRRTSIEGSRACELRSPRRRRRDEQPAVQARRARGCRYDDRARGSGRCPRRRADHRGCRERRSLAARSGSIVHRPRDGRRRRGTRAAPSPYRRRNAAPRSGGRARLARRFGRCRRLGPARPVAGSLARARTITLDVAFSVALSQPFAEPGHKPIAESRPSLAPTPTGTDEPTETQTAEPTGTDDSGGDNSGPGGEEAAAAVDSDSGASGRGRCLEGSPSPGVDPCRRHRAGTRSLALDRGRSSRLRPSQGPVPRDAASP